MTRRGQPRARWEIADVLAHTDLTALLDDLAEPGTHAVRGRRWHCPMPDHDDHHASVTTHTDHRGHERWRCWSGDQTHRGDAIDLVMATQRLDRAHAIDWLAHRAGMIPDQPLPPVYRKPSRAPARSVPLDPAVIRYAEACERILWSNGGRPLREWPHARGLTDEVLHANRVGADPGRRAMPRRQGLPYGATPAAVFPALNPDGKIHYLQARYVEPVAADKYDNPAGALGSNPRLAWARTPAAAPRPGVLIVCEGIPDALTAAAAGLAAVGVLGSQAPDERATAQLARHSSDHHRQLIAVVDADPAGRAWGERLGTLLRAHDLELTVIEPAVGGDLNDWARHDPTWTTHLDRIVDRAVRRATPHIGVA
ncbi:MAG: toprim domain-containing protein [Microbacteriaceae bacterium]